MRHPITLVALVGLAALACNDHQPASTSGRPAVASEAVPKSSTLQEATIPADASYTILDSSAIAGVKRSLVVRLEKKVSEQTLQGIALQLKAQDPREYQRTFITYYLPGMVLGAGAWATTHFNPDLEVQILGLTAAQEQKLVAEAVPAKREIVGRWLDESPYVASRIAIFHEGKKPFIELAFKDGSSLKKELVETESRLGRRFDKADGSRAGDHWVIGPDGNLQIRDNGGLITLARKLE